MNITYFCSKCSETAQSEQAGDTTEIVCPYCQDRKGIPSGAISGEQLTRCLVCPSMELFIRKSFPQRVGVTIVALGFAISCVTWYHTLIFWTYGVLFATAAIDIVLYMFVGNLLECYRCQAQYREIEGLDDFAPFNLETYERYRQQKARLAAGSTMASSTMSNSPTKQTS